MKEKLEAMQTSLEYLERINLTLSEELDSIRSGKDMKAISDLMDGVLVLLRMFNLTRDYHDVVYDEEGIKGLTAELLEAVENLDIVLVTDIVEYEFMPKLSNWEKELREAIGRYE